MTPGNSDIRFKKKLKDKAGTLSTSFTKILSHFVFRIFVIFSYIWLHTLLQIWAVWEILLTFIFMSVQIPFLWRGGKLRLIWTNLQDFTISERTSGSSLKLAMTAGARFALIAEDSRTIGLGKQNSKTRSDLVLTENKFAAYLLELF